MKYQLPDTHPDAEQGGPERSMPLPAVPRGRIPSLRAQLDAQRIAMGSAAHDLALLEARDALTAAGDSHSPSSDQVEVCDHLSSLHPPPPADAHAEPQPPGAGYTSFIRPCPPLGVPISPGGGALHVVWGGARARRRRRLTRPLRAEVKLEHSGAGDRTAEPFALRYDQRPSARLHASTPPRMSLAADDSAGPFARSRSGRSNRGLVVLVWLAAAGLGLYARDSFSPRPGTVIVPVRPSDAAVSIDGQQFASQSGLFKVTDLASNRDYLIQVSHKGFLPESRRVRLSAGEVRILPTIDLEAQPNSTAVIPAKAPTRENGLAPAGTRASAAAPKKPSDEHGVRPAASSPHGILRINSLPWTHVSIDGRLIGTTPQRYIALAPGQHRIKLVNPELGLSKDVSIQIEPGQTLTKSVVLLE